MHSTFWWCRKAAHLHTREESRWAQKCRRVTKTALSCLEMAESSLRCIFIRPAITWSRVSSPPSRPLFLPSCKISGWAVIQKCIWNSCMLEHPLEWKGQMEVCVNRMSQRAGWMNWDILITCDVSISALGNSGCFQVFATKLNSLKWANKKKGLCSLFGPLQLWWGLSPASVVPMKSLILICLENFEENLCVVVPFVLSISNLSSPSHRSHWHMWLCLFKALICLQQAERTTTQKQ